VNPLKSPWLIAISRLYMSNQFLFYLLAGRGAFMPAMAWGRPFVPPLLWSYLGSCMFHHLFEWSADSWHPIFRPLYFQEVPSIGSSRNLAQWLQQIDTGEFRQFDYGDPKINAKHYAGKPTPPSYNLSTVRCPIALVTGGRDALINVDKLINTLPNVVYTKNVDEWYHVDVLNAMNAPDILFPDLLSLCEQRLPMAKAMNNGMNNNHSRTSNSIST
jgi:hypothetical protein